MASTGVKNLQDGRLLLVGDDPLARAGLATLLVDQPGWQVVGQYASRQDLDGAVAAHAPDVVLWDLGWQPQEGLERLADFSRDVPPEVAVPVVALLPGPEWAAAAWQAGVHSLLPRDVDAPTLGAALTAARQRLWVLAPELAPSLPLRSGGSSGEELEPLTPRELEVLQLMAEGLANKAIARELQISEHTVKFHVNAILSKLGVQSRTEAVVQATRAGLIFL